MIDNIPKDVPEAIRLAELATTEYKNSQYPYEVLPYIQNLLGYVSVEVLERAIMNASAGATADHQYRPSFKNKFINEQAVKELADMPVRRQDSDDKTSQIPF